MNGEYPYCETAPGMDKLKELLSRFFVTMMVASAKTG